MKNPIAAVNALAWPADDALAAGRFAEFAPLLRQALVACPRGRRIEVVLSPPVWGALAMPAIERLGRARFYAYRDAFLERANGDMARAFAEFWFAAAVGEVGFDA